MTTKTSTKLMSWTKRCYSFEDGIREFDNWANSFANIASVNGPYINIANTTTAISDFIITGSVLYTINVEED